MLDIKIIREDPKRVKASCKARGYDENLVDDCLRVDKEWRALKYDEDKLRSERNKVSKEISDAKKAKDDARAKKAMKRAKEIPQKLARLSLKEKEIKERMDAYLLSFPNFQESDVPVGGEEKNKVILTSGKKPTFSFKVKGHDELLEDLGLLDMKAGAKLAGSGFYLFKGAFAQLERALINYMIDFHVNNGFSEVNPPHVCKKDALYGTGQLPKFEDDLYKTKEGLYLIPTSEVSLTNIHSGETLKEKDLPKKYVGFTQCYRTEAGRHGTETPGFFRVHQFEKVEMVYLSTPEESWKILETMTGYAEKILSNLKIPYQKVLLATKDASFASAKTYDLEVWSPKLKKYLEASSCSNCTDFQARRMNTRYQSKDGLAFVHTLNGSGLATPRLLISLVENYQQKDGSIKIPKVLQSSMGGKTVISKK